MRQAAILVLLAVSLPAPRAGDAQARALTHVNVVNVNSGAIERNQQETVKVSTADDLLERALSSNTATPDQWNALGRAFYDARRYREAVASFERGMKLNTGVSSDGAWNVARAYAQLGNRKQALRWLAHARELGFRNDVAIRDEPAFEKYHGDPGFRALVLPTTCTSCRGWTGRGVTLI